MVDVTTIEEMRETRDINTTTMNALCGYSGNSAYTNAVKTGYMSPQKRQRCLDIFQYYDDHGIVPVPNEIQH